MGDAGRVVGGYEGQHCQLDTCQIPLTAETGAFLHKNLETGKLLMFCEEHSAYIELNYPHRWPLIPL